MVKLLKWTAMLFRKLRSIIAFCRKESGLYSPGGGEYFYEKNRLEEALPLFLGALEAARLATIRACWFRQWPAFPA
jgi:hypothetical protein